MTEFSVFFKIQSQKKILVGCNPLDSVTRGGKETTAEKVISHQRRWLKRSLVFWKKGWHHQLPPGWVTPTLLTPLYSC